jgi:hypothetical protein
MRSRLRTILQILIGTGAAVTIIGTLIFPPLRFPGYREACPGVGCMLSDWSQAAVDILAWLVFWAWAWWMVTLVFRSRAPA